MARVRANYRHSAGQRLDNHPPELLFPTPGSPGGQYQYIQSAQVSGHLSMGDMLNNCEWRVSRAALGQLGDLTA